MNFLGMGPMELLLIIVLALIVFGPAKLPEIMGQVGKAINDFRRATTDLSEEFNKTIQAELQETRSVVEEAKSVMTDARSAVTDVHSSVNSAVTGVPAPLRVAEPNGTGTNGTSTEAKPALADTSQWSWETAAPAEPKPADAGTGEAAVTPEVTDAPTATEPSVVEPGAEASVAPNGEASVGESDEASTKPKAAGRDELVPPY